MSHTSEETEISAYGKIEDPEHLKQADQIEKHIQLEQLLVSGDKIRVRKTTPVRGGPEGVSDTYELTIKCSTPDAAGMKSCQETTQEVDRNFYEQFAKVASRGIVKTRYTFIGKPPVIKGIDESIVLPPIKYEIDVFTNVKTNEPASLIKLDIELNDILDELKKNGIDTQGVKQKFNLQNLPFSLNGMFAPQNMTAEQKQMLDNFWDNEAVQMLAPDKFTKIKSAPAPVVAATPVQQEPQQQEQTTEEPAAA